MSLNRSIGNAEVLKKRVPKNPKYQHVKTRLDTGCSLTKYMERMEDIKKNYRYRKDEIFKRLKVKTFAQLILQVSTISDLTESDDGESQAAGDSVSVVSDADLECLSERTNGSPQASFPTHHQDAGPDRDKCYSARSTLLSVINGVGELNLDRNDQTIKNESVVSPVRADRPYPDCPYLLLDVRDRDEYDRCHIISAHSFPIAMLSRTMNPYTKEVLEYKNAAGKIIIVYDEDERIASQAATNMCQRGVENLFMLSGGLKVVAQNFPEGMTTGTIPASCLSSASSSKRKKNYVTQQPSEERTAENRWRFTSEELAKIQDQMDELLVSSNSSSRMSTSSSQSTASSVRSSSGRTGTRVQSSRPWK